ncbi:unnamed protein product [Tilletia controversa]|uniref:K Homology domain-containing protein n=3 Tax=Tilletia TaxID=13289 RepID=A0A8X7MRA7_9BASI|nr:hypothetical protein CF336_g8062 [Tilletia laevis]KAE8184316.1 hypothetical protein CF328_g7899 [Tilletia controversa]KAE8241180.1 hypothetical protein A4X03_0g8198 [Tilletia caries]KAE8184738.1 hypothetical protein CF335_g7934 [Tilletia laevis]KAE8246514.1 hypothetical protein A4X06_0g4989 [Tilletia controversa]
MSSKWDQAAGGSELSEAAQAAAAAAARIAAQFGSSMSAAGQPRTSASGGDAGARAQPEHEAPFQFKIEINDQRNRYMLTKGQTQQQIHRDTGASVTTKGQWYPDKTLATADEPPLYLHITGTTQEMVDQAVGKIHELMEADLPQLVEDRHAKRIEWESQRPPPREIRERRRWPEEKVSIDLTPLRNFNVRAKVVGPAGLFVKFIQQETGAKVQIKGQGSGFVETDTQRESDEPMHIHLACQDEDALKEAKRLAEDLVDAVRTEHAKAEAVMMQQQQQFGGGQFPQQGYGGPRPGFGQNGFGNRVQPPQGGAGSGYNQQPGQDYNSTPQGTFAVAAAVQSPTQPQSVPAAAAVPVVKEEEDAVDKYWKDYAGWEKTFRNYHGRAPTKEDGGQTIPPQYMHLLS